VSLITWLYLVDVASELDGFFQFTAILCIIAGLILAFIFFVLINEDAGDEGWALWRKAAKLTAIIGTSGFLLAAIIPSEKSLYLMLGAKTTQDIIANPKVQETGGKVLDLINKKLEEFAEPKK
jgi:hypothetical protein